MVDRLQYQNQAYGSPQVVPPSQQQLQPQIIIPTTTPTSAGTAAATNLPQKQAVNNPGQFRQLQQVPRFVQRGTTIRYIQQQGPRIVAVQRATSTQYIRTNVVRQLPPGVVLVRSQYQNQIYEMPQHQQQYQGQSNARPQQRIFVNNTVQYRQIQHQGGQRYFAVQNQSYGSQILQQQQQSHAQVILPSTTAAANVQEQKHSINNTVQLQHIQQQSQRTVVQLVTPKEEIPDDLIKNEVMVPEPSDENITAGGGGDGGAGSTQQSTDGFMTISINNVVCNYSLPMHIDLRKVALNSWNCSYDRTGSILTKQKRHPGCHVKVYNSGKVYIVGCKSEAASRQAARSVGREIQKIMGKTDQKISLRKFRINNILATCKFPFGILIDQVNRKYPKETYYEPELTVGLIWRMTEPKASVRIHTTGTIVVTGATSEADVSIAVEKIYGFVQDFKCDISKISHPAPRKRKPVINEEFSNIKRQKREFGDEDGEDETGMDQIFDDENEINDF